MYTLYSSDCGKLPYELDKVILLNVYVLIEQFNMRKSLKICTAF